MDKLNRVYHRNGRRNFEFPELRQFFEARGVRYEDSPLLHAGDEIWALRKDEALQLRGYTRATITNIRHKRRLAIVSFDAKTHGTGIAHIQENSADATVFVLSEGDVSKVEQLVANVPLARIPMADW